MAQMDPHQKKMNQRSANNTGLLSSPKRKECQYEFWNILIPKYAVFQETKHFLCVCPFFSILQGRKTPFSHFSEARLHSICVFVGWLLVLLRFELKRHADYPKKTS